jgi:hypothetical protein
MLGGGARAESGYIYSCIIQLICFFYGGLGYRVAVLLCFMLGFMPYNVPRSASALAGGPARVRCARGQYDLVQYHYLCSCTPSALSTDL